MNSTRRGWFASCVAMAAWPEVLGAQGHARMTAGSGHGHFDTLDRETAGEIEAIAAQIIPSAGGPGAREAGVIYFIDRALTTFAAAEREAYRVGMAEVQEKRKALFPDSTKIALLSGEQQIELIRSFETSDFFELLRMHTVLGFLGNPSYGGNRNKVGWRAIGFEDRMSHERPFGYYDSQREG